MHQLNKVNQLGIAGQAEREREHLQNLLETSNNKKKLNESQIMWQYCPKQSLVEENIYANHSW